MDQRLRTSQPSLPASPVSDDAKRNLRIAILGGGFSGMGMAIMLLRRGYANVAIFEKAADFGGTWRENTYPGVACDVPSHLYSFSFAPNPNWSRRFSPGPEIWSYLQDCARRFGLYERARFGKRVTRITHDGAAWTIAFSDGGTATADVVVSGLGGLHEPNKPAFAGAETFRGAMFHTAEWRHDVDLSGKKVAIIGSAASAVQVIPEIAPQVAHLDVYQRTANWVMPRESYAYPAWARGLFRSLPPLARAYRGFYFSLMEFRHGAFRAGENPIKKFVGEQFRKHLDAQVADPELRAKLTPDYPIGCKRILISDRYLPTIQRPNVSLVTDPIAGIEPDGVRTADGALRPADVIILATGFKPFNLLASIDVIGPTGKSLADVWSAGIIAHRTVAVPEMPNFFMLLGPNSGLGHNSVVLMIEAQVRYIIALLDEMLAKGAVAVQPTHDATRAFDERLQRELGETVWAGGCKSWYLDETGRNYTLYPHPVRSYLREMKKPQTDEFAFSAAHAQQF